MSDDPVAAAEPAQATSPPKARKQVLVTIYRAWCKKCGICIDMCPRKVFDRDPMNAPLVNRQPDCTGCLQCELHCPDLAIRIDRVKRQEG